MLVEMSTEQLREFVKKIRTYAASPQTLSAGLREESDSIKKPRVKSAAAIAKEAKIKNLIAED